MRVVKTERGFDVLEHPTHIGVAIWRLAQQSSAVGDYPDALDRPGTSALWIGADHHLDREEVAEFVRHLQRWLDTGRLRE